LALNPIHEYDLDSNPDMAQVAEEGRASNLKAAGTIFIGVVGAGVLGLPYAFAQASSSLRAVLAA